MTTLITGAAGFIGFHVARRLLERGERVLGIDIVNDYYSTKLKRDRLARQQADFGDAFRVIEIDFADHAALETALEGEDFDGIVHLGAQAGVRYSIEQPRAYVQSNLVGHLNLMEIARHRRSRHLVYASSSSVYGGNDTLPFRVEDRVDHPLSLYAATKKADELMSETYAHLYRLPQTGLRFFTVYGPWGRPDMSAYIFTRAILRGEPIKVFNRGDMRRDFTYVDDIVAGVLAALDHVPAGTGGATPHRRYNLGNSHTEPLLRFIEVIERATNHKAILELTEMQPGDVKETYADIEAAKRDIGFSPRTSIDEGIPRFVAWFRQYHGI